MAPAPLITFNEQFFPGYHIAYDWDGIQNGVFTVHAIVTLPYGLNGSVSTTGDLVSLIQTLDHHSIGNLYATDFDSHDYIVFYEQDEFEVFDHRMIFSNRPLFQGQQITFTETNLGDYVNPVPPDAHDDALSATQRTISLQHNVITDVPGTDIEAEGNALSITGVTFGATAGTFTNGQAKISGAHGTLTINADGSYNYDASAEGVVKIGDTVTDTFTYTVSNGLLFGTANLVVTVTGSATGNSGNNTFLLTGSGTTATGGDGDDLYVIDSLNDVVDETGSTGTDTVQSGAVSVYLFSNGIGNANLKGDIENVTLTGAANLDAAGNGLVNKLTGNSGSNTLNGLGGADAMAGGGGNDTYVIEDAGDVADETGTAGTDRVLSGNLSIDLTDNVHFLGQIENVLLTGGLDLNVTGNALANTLAGNSGANRLDGGAGADAMRGLGGNDTYVVDSAADIVDENAAGSGGTDTVQASVSVNLTNTVRYRGDVENVTLTGSTNLSATGNTLDNVLTGNDGVNFLGGREGADVLTGGLGSDYFVFDTAAVAGFVDTITDFAYAVGNNDTVRLATGVFVALTGNVNSYLSAGQFTANTDGVAKDGDDRIVYETDTGKLFYDADGSGSGDAVQFAQFGAGATHPTITNLDFFLV